MSDPIEPVQHKPVYDPKAHAPIERKVTASTFSAGALVALLTSVLALIEGDQLIEGVPDWVAVLLACAISAGGTFVAGKAAPHTARRDLPPNYR